MADGKHSRSWSFHFVAEMEEIQTYEEGQNLSIVFNGKQIPLVKIYLTKNVQPEGLKPKLLSSYFILNYKTSDEKLLVLV